MKPIYNPYTTALKSYHSGERSKKLNVRSEIFEEYELPLPLLFRSFDEMPLLEKNALKIVKGKTLDIGAGVGSHSFYLQQKNIDVTAIDKEIEAVDIMKSRGVRNAQAIDFFNLKNQTFDTLLLLMNGIGIVGKAKNLDLFFFHCKSLLNPQGQIILDSSDILFLYEQEDGTFWMDAEADYYGDVTYWFEYDGVEGEPFDWLYVDFNTLLQAADRNGFYCQRIFEDDHHGFLVKMGLKEFKPEDL